MELTDLPNIGPVLASNLRTVGLDTPEKLRQAGAKEAWLKIRLQVDPGACLHLLQALAGAVANIPKRELTPEQRLELKKFFESYK